MNKIQRRSPFSLVSFLSLFCMALLLTAGCSKDNIEYNVINNHGLLCKVIGLTASKQNYEDGVMTPVDGTFMMFSCEIDDFGEKGLRKIIPMKNKDMPYGLLKSVDFGDFKVEYYRTGIWERIYMTEYQIDSIKDFIRDR